MTRIINNSNFAAVQRATMIRQQHGQVARNNTRLWVMPRPQLTELVQEIVASSPTIEDCYRFARVVQDIQERQRLDAARIEEEVRETTPFGGLVKFWSSRENRQDIHDILEIILAIAMLIIGLRAVVLSEDKIADRVVELMEQDSQPEPPTTTPPTPTTIRPAPTTQNRKAPNEGSVDSSRGQVTSR